MWGQGFWLQQTWEVLHKASVLLEKVTISSTTEPPRRQPINWRTIMPKKFLNCCKSSRAHNRFSNLEIWQRDWEPLGNLTLKASGIWLQNFHRTGETLLKGTNKTCCVPGPRRKEKWHHKRLNQPCLLKSRSLWWRHGSTVACHVVRGTKYNSPGCWHKSFWRRSASQPLPLQ